MTNHNLSTVSDILLKNGTARLEDFYPLTKVKTVNNGELGFFRKYPFLVEYSELYGKI